MMRSHCKTRYPDVGKGRGISVPFNASIVRDPQHVEKVIDRLRVKYRSMWSEVYHTKRDVYVEVTV